MDDHLLVDLTRLKTKNDQRIAIYCAPDDWSIDPFHSLASMLLCDQYQTSNKLFPHLPTESGESNISSYINRVLSNVGDVLEKGTYGPNFGNITPKLQSHSARRGSATVAASNPHISLADVGHRGMWKLDGFHTVFEYLAASNANDQRVGKVLSGWTDPSYTGFPPSLFAIKARASSETKEKISTFVSTISSKYFSKLTSSTFKETLIASLLMYLNDTLKFFSEVLLGSSDTLKTLSCWYVTFIC